MNKEIEVSGTYYTKHTAYEAEAYIICNAVAWVPAQRAVRNSYGEQIDPSYDAYIEDVTDWEVVSCFLTRENKELLAFGNAFQRKIVESIVNWDKVIQELSDGDYYD